MTVDATPISERHVGGTLTRMIVEHFRTHGGPEAVEELLRRANEHRAIAVLTEDGSWSSYGQFRRLLEAAAAMLGGVDRLIDIGHSAALAAGSMPGATETLQALGSPAALFELIGQGQNGILTIVEATVEERGPTEWVIFNRFIEPFEPFPEFCAFALGLNELAPQLFGFEHVAVHEESCLCRGDVRCACVIRWDASDDSARDAAYLRTRLELLELRMEAFQRTVADLVAAEDLETMLTRVVASAARAIRAPAFVLALEPMAWATDHVYSEGISGEEADRVAGLALALGSPEEFVGGLAVDVASTRRRYGRLVAVDPTGTVFSLDRVSLEAYARLAATALDWATAIEDARRQAASAHALLGLSTALAAIVTPDEMAGNLARAIPVVVDCDAAFVVLIDDDRTKSRIAASHGFVPSVERALRSMHVPVDDDVIRELRYYDQLQMPSRFSDAMAVHGVAAMVAVPVSIDGDTVGCLVAAVNERPERLIPSPQLEDSLHGLASQASTALRNSRLVEQISHQALHDSLTGLPNRTLALDRVDSMLARARRSRGPAAALFIDLDGFKDINDTQGHAVGDQLLQAVAIRLNGAVRDSDTVARLGGDEFVVLTDGEPLDIGPELVADRLLAVLNEPYLLDGVASEVRITASIGIAVGDRTTAGELLRDADLALYRAKSAGKNCYRMFEPEMQTAVRDRVELERDLGEALARNEFFLVYQPIFDLRASNVIGVEALLRWQHPTRGLVMPDDFIPVMEDTGMIVAVGRWVLQQACRQAKSSYDAGYRIYMSVNLSLRQLESGRLVDDVEMALASAGVDPATLILEITETAIMRDVPNTVRRLEAIKKLGVRIAIDDFGTGYSSLAYLQQFPVDAIKIDRAFITGIAESSEATALLRTLIQLGKTLGLSTLAEGIEDTGQYAALQDEDCESGQGFLLARPLDASALAAFLDDRDESPSRGVGDVPDREAAV